MNRAVSLWRSTIGKKVVMAVTGLVLFGYLIAHMLGNTQFFASPDELTGAEKINEYSHFLHSMPAFLWAARIVLLASVVLHILASVQLTGIRRAARPIAYQKVTYQRSTLAGRTMMLTGPLLLVFVVYHVLHMTTGQAHPDFVEGDVFHNLIQGFEVRPVAVFYVIAMGAVGFHLLHGAWSLFQTLGVNHPRYNPVIREAARVMTFLVAGGFVIVPLAVMLGLHRR